MTFAKSDETLAFRVIANLQDLINDLKSAGKSTAALDLLIKELNKELAKINTVGLAQAKQDLAGADDNMRKLKDDTAIAVQLLIDMAKEYENVKVAAQALATENEKNIKFNKNLMAQAMVTTPDPAFAKAVLAQEGKFTLDPRAIKAASDELENLRKIQAEFAKEGANTWTVMNNMLRLVNKEAVQLRSNIDAIKNIASQAQKPGQSLEELRLAFERANASTGLFTRGEVSQAFSELAKRIPTATLALKDYLATIQKTGQTWGSMPIEQAAQKITNLKGTVTGLGQELKNANGIAQVFFGSTLANIASRALREVTGYMREAIQAGNEWSRTLFNMGVAVRGLQRTGIDITMAEMNAQVDLLRQRFAFFTTRELQGGIAQIALLTRNVGLSKQEIFELSEATATLAIITGKDFAEEGLLVARSIASGYTEALQRAGIAANRLAIQEKALTLGINKSFLQMTEQERAAVTLALVLDQVAAISEDTAAFQKTLAGRLQVTTVAIKEQKDALGKEWLPMWVSVREFFVTLIPAIKVVSDVLRISFIGLAAMIGAEFITLGVVITGFFNGLKFSAKDVVKIWVDAFHEMRVAIEDNLKEFEMPDVTDDQKGIFEPDFSEDNTEELQEEVDRMKDQIWDILRDFTEGVQDAWMEVNRKLADIEVEFFRKAEDEWTDYQNDIEQVIRKSQDDIEEAQDKYREKELKAEEDFQEKMLRLREKFLLDLEDALRERDAKQVLRLIRQFNLQSAQLQREEDLEAKQRQRAFENELADIQRQKEIKLRELEIEYNERLEQLAIEKQREIDDTWKWFWREMEDLDIQKRRRLQHLRDSLDAEYQMFFDHAMRMLNLGASTVEQLNAIWSQLAFGLIGLSMGIPANQINPYDPASYGYPPIEYDDPDDKKHKKTPGFAEGGTLIAKRPTMAVFGEKGPEVAHFSPLRRVGRDEGKVFGGRMSTSSSDNRVTVELLLSPDLEQRIVDRALDETSEVIVRTVGR